MPPNTKIDFSDAHQDRSKRTLEDLLEAAYKIVDDANPNDFNGRHLSHESGYALGTLNKRLGPIENVFLWAIEKGRDVKIENMINSIIQFDPHSSIQDFAELITEISFAGIGKTTSKVIRYYEGKMLKRDGHTYDSINFIDAYIDPYLKIVYANQTNTFRKISEDETRLLLRSMRQLIERPFVNDDPIAGTEEHRRIVIESFVRLFGN